MGKYLDSREPVKQTCPIINEAQDCISELYVITSSYDEYITKASISDIDSNLNRLKIILEELRTANSSLRDWGNDWCEKALEIEKDVDYITDEYESRIDSLESDIRDYKSDIHGYNDEISSLKDKISSLEDDVYNLNIKIDNLECN